MIIVTRPVAGEVLATGSKHQIKWDKYGVGSVDILFSSDDGVNTWQVIQKNISEGNSFLWQVPKKLDSRPVRNHGFAKRWRHKCYQQGQRIIFNQAISFQARFSAGLEQIACAESGG